MTCCGMPGAAASRWSWSGPPTGSPGRFGTSSRCWTKLNHLSIEFVSFRGEPRYRRPTRTGRRYHHRGYRRVGAEPDHRAGPGRHAPGPARRKAYRAQAARYRSCRCSSRSCPWAEPHPDRQVLPDLTGYRQPVDQAGPGTGSISRCSKGVPQGTPHLLESTHPKIPNSPVSKGVVFETTLCTKTSTDRSLQFSNGNQFRVSQSVTRRCFAN